MRFLKHRRLHVNMGNFEHVEISATVEIDTVADAEALKEFGIPVTDTFEEVEDFIEERLDSLLAPDVEDAAVHTDKEESFILPYQQDKKRSKS